MIWSPQRARSGSRCSGYKGWVAALAWLACALGLALPARPVLAQATADGRPLQVVMLLPLENASLRRAAQAVESGVKAALAYSAPGTRLHSCAYGASINVVTAYLGCVTEDTDWVIGPLGRSDVAALAQAQLLIPRPTLMLSPLGHAPVAPLAVLAPELEAEAEAIAQAAAEDGCRKPLLLEGSGPMAVRGSTAIHAYWRERQAATQTLDYHNLAQSPRSEWQRINRQWRSEGIDCILYSGTRKLFADFYPYLGRGGPTVYVTSAVYDAPLSTLYDWSGVRIADMPWLLHPETPAFQPFQAAQPTDLTLTRLYALGLDAAQLTLVAGRGALPEHYDGAIGHLQLRGGQYLRSPALSTFRASPVQQQGVPAVPDRPIAPL